MQKRLLANIKIELSFRWFLSYIKIIVNMFDMYVILKSFWLQTTQSTGFDILHTDIYEAIFYFFIYCVLAGNIN